MPTLNSEGSRYNIVAIYSQTATLYDCLKNKEIYSVDMSFGDESEIRKLYEKCIMLNAKHEEDLLYLKVINEL